MNTPALPFSPSLAIASPSLGRTILLLKRSLWLLVFTAWTLSASAQTTMGSWRMGEDDPGAVIGNSVNLTLSAAVGTDLIAQYSGGPLGVYSNDTRGAPSSLAATFTGYNMYGYGNNFGFGSNGSLGYAVEAWFKTTTLSGLHFVALVGFSGVDGLGIVLNSSDVYITKAGAGLFAPAAVTANTWLHVGLVVDSNNATLYLNGASTGSVAYTNGYNPSFSIGSNDSSGGRFIGLIDDVRMFSFSTGTFSPSMLNYAAVPEPSVCAAIAGLATLGFAALRRRQRTAL